VRYRSCATTGTRYKTAGTLETEIPWSNRTEDAQVNILVHRQEKELQDPNNASGSNMGQVQENVENAASPGGAVETYGENR
jgi:hypothetical protein